MRETGTGQQVAQFHERVMMIVLMISISSSSSSVFYTTNEMQLIQCSLLLSALYMFRAVFPPIIRSL